MIDILEDTKDLDLHLFLFDGVDEHLRVGENWDGSKSAREGKVYVRSDG